jgi:hypothetical protein
MSFFKSALVAGGLTLAFVSGIAAQGGGDPWDIKERMAYVFMMDGTTKQVRLNDKGHAMLMKEAKKLPRGTAFIMSGGDLYMIDVSKMFDKAGMPVFGGT